MRIPLISEFKQHRILGGVAVLAVTQFGASLVGLIRDRVLASTFPGLDTVDVYQHFAQATYCFRCVSWLDFPLQLFRC